MDGVVLVARPKKQALRSRASMTDGILPPARPLAAARVADAIVETAHGVGRAAKGLAFTLLLSIVSINFTGIGYTHAYFNDNETSTSNKFNAGLIDFDALITASSSAFARINCTPHATSSQMIEIKPNASSNPFKYYPDVDNMGGDECFCNQIDVTAYLNGVKVYKGPLAGLSSTATTTTGTWKFEFSTSVNTANYMCSYDVAFKGWQTRHNYPSYEHGGYTDIERVHNTLSSWGIRINKVYDDVGPGRGAEGDNEWVELYNQTNTSINLTGWKLCDGALCDAFPTTTKRIPAGGFALVTSATSTFDYWNVPSGIQRIVLPDGRIGDGLGDHADMLVLKRPDGAIVDQMNWGTTSPAWVNVNADVWSPGVTDDAEGSMLARKPTGFDTNSVSDWVSLLPPVIDLVSPDEGDFGSIWKQGEVRNILWTAHNQNGPDSALKIGLYLIKDTNGNHVIDKNDTIKTITAKTDNDGQYQYKVPGGFKGDAWIRAIATGPENPLANSMTTSGKFTIEKPKKGGSGNDNSGECALGDFAPDDDSDYGHDKLFGKIDEKMNFLDGINAELEEKINDKLDDLQSKVDGLLAGAGAADFGDDDEDAAPAASADTSSTGTTTEAAAPEKPEKPTAPEKPEKPSDVEEHIAPKQDDGGSTADVPADTGKAPGSDDDETALHEDQKDTVVSEAHDNTSPVVPPTPVAPEKPTAPVKPTAPTKPTH